MLEIFDTTFTYHIPISLHLQLLALICPALICHIDFEILALRAEQKNAQQNEAGKLKAEKCWAMR